MAGSQAVRGGVVGRDAVGAVAAAAARRPSTKGNPKRTVQQVVSVSRTRRRPASDTNQQRNFILARFSTEQTDFTRGALDLATVFPVEQGALKYPDGTRALERTERERLTAVMGPGATIHGVAEIITDLINQSAATKLTVAQVADGLTQYNSWVTSRAGQDTWQVGVRLPLPIEIPPGQQKLIVDAQTLGQLATTRRKAGASAATTNVVADLPLPDADAVTRDATNAINAQGTTPASRGVALAATLVENPFLVVFEVIETLRQYAGGPTGRSNDEHAFAQSLVDSLSDWQAIQLGALTAGNAVLRRLWRALRLLPNTPTAPADVLDRVGNALGLKKTVDGTWRDPTYYFIDDQESATAAVPVGPTVVPLELAVAVTHLSNVDGRPLVASQHDHAMVLGRDLDVGRRAPFKQTDTLRVEGTENNGTLSPQDLHVPIGGNAPTLIADRQAVAVAISAAEGKLDACRSAGLGLLSLGIQQWTINDNTELTTLLHRFRQLSPDHFDLYFGLYGMQTVLTANPEPANPTSGTGLAAANAANPDWRSTRIFDVGGAVYVTLWLVRAGQDVTADNCRLPPGDNRARYFGSDLGTSLRIMSNDWSARGRLAAFGSIDFRLNQVQFSVLRFERVKHFVGSVTIPNTNGVRKTATELFSSKLGAAAILDTHINRPLAITEGLPMALARTPGNALDANGANGLSNEWLDRFVINFIIARTIKAKLKDNRNKVLLEAHDKALPASPGSFHGW
jgi:hypothetical protein